MDPNKFAWALEIVIYLQSLIKNLLYKGNMFYFII
jgi:hypothetical protein